MTLGVANNRNKLQLAQATRKFTGVPLGFLIEPTGRSQGPARNSAMLFSFLSLPVIFVSWHLLNASFAKARILPGLFLAGSPMPRTVPAK